MLDIIYFLFQELLHRPLFNSLVFLYQTIAFYDFGIAIIVLTVIIRLLLYPLAQKSIKSQKEMTGVQSDIKKIQEQYKNNKEEQTKRIMSLYKEKNINPFSGCLPLLIQLPLLIALYRVFLAGFQDQNLQSLLYGFMPNPGTINHIFLGLVDISKNHNIFLALITGALQFYQSKMMMDQQKTNNKLSKQSNLDFSATLSRQMTFMMPIMTAYFAYTFPAGLALYWIVTTAFSIGQQWMVFKNKDAPSIKTKNSA